MLRQALALARMRFDGQWFPGAAGIHFSDKRRQLSRALRFVQAASLTSLRT